MSTITGFDDKSNGWNKAVVQRLGGVLRADALLRGELTVSEKSSRVLFVDRSVKPAYPDWVKELPKETRELEATGLEQYDPSNIPLYLHPKQKNGGRLEGNSLYAFLKESGLIEHCLSFRDGEELVKHPACYPESWKDKYIFLWKSVVLESKSNLAFSNL